MPNQIIITNEYGMEDVLLDAQRPRTVGWYQTTIGVRGWRLEKGSPYPVIYSKDGTKKITVKVNDG